MNEKPKLPATIGGAEITRFNALRHGVLSRYTVLPWEDRDEYQALVASLVAEHVPQGPTEEHLVEELAGILWRKRRLRLAEAAAHRRGLEDAVSPSRKKTAKAAVVHINVSDGSENVAEAIRATEADTEDAHRVPIGGGEWEEVNETIDIVRVPCRYGGTRPYFICPGVVNGIACGRRVAKLYGPRRYFLCRHCFGHTEIESTVRYLGIEVDDALSLSEQVEL
jgi:hypothetical protein